MPALHTWFAPALAAALASWAAEHAERADPGAANREASSRFDVYRAPPASTDGSVVGPPDAIEGCEDWLEASGVRFEPARIPLHETSSGILCGAPQAVRYISGPAKLRWNGKPRVACPVALALGRFETVVHEEALRHLERPVKKIRHMGTYNCREMAAYPGWVSEHSYGNAIDIRSFVLVGGREIPVLGNYGVPGAPATPAERFLQAVTRRAYDEDIFSVVLTPAFDRLHRNHLHLDMARYRVDGTVPD